MAIRRSKSAARPVLLLTFGLTVLVDLTVAIRVSATPASPLFMARMAETVVVDSSGREDDDLDSEEVHQ